MASDRFSAEAAAWDNNPFIHIQSESAWQAIRKQFPGYFGNANDGSFTGVQKPAVLEIGAGTGTLTLRMAPYASQIVAVDAAEGMINALQIKLEKPDAAKNVTAIYALLEDPEDKVLPPAGDGSEGRLKYELITSHLVLHHIADIPAVLKTMYGCLKPGGWVALTDFEDFGPAARKFHPESKMVGVERHGIPREWMAGLLRDAGFVDVDVKVAWSTKKTVEKFPGEFGNHADAANASQGEPMDFPFVLCLGKKP
ncbi:S-adenosyl-L-methionine-dependent methyltransferase [Microdochium trichocladiopsis]|uniref:S-adenosyl-L-methionine-dependent methyltransferase n=1 Tax=Microdochium trichocladiopsis TaxID=1682393 RepID=A0A9P8YIX7_9PEZI|nr:S-adenosyl-L-methionine-dependent methyltransferase [Microdochium trichocladiopsis]KAH7040201.1 S-adenosyl-L-methionine-dependent methyltransferase [Microdochium trichocladiopsis]